MEYKHKTDTETILPLKEEFNMMPDMSYNPQFGGYNQSFFNPYGMGGGMPSLSSMQFGGGYPGMGSGMPFFSGMQTGGGYPSMDIMPQQMAMGLSPGGYPGMGGEKMFMGGGYGQMDLKTTSDPKNYWVPGTQTGPSFSGMQTGGGYPSMDMGMAPGGFMNNFQSQLQDMFSKYFNQGQVAVDPAAGGPAPTAGTNTGTSTTVGSTQPTTPDFGNLGARFDKGKTLTRKAERKLNRMGYTDDNIYNASQAGGGAQGFRNALGNLSPNYKTQTSAGTYTR